MNPRLAFIAAPLFTMAYGVIRILDGLDGERGPGIAWTTGHLAFIAALGLFVVTFLEMRKIAGKNALSTISATAGIVGIVALTAQFGIDIVIGFMAEDRAAMGVLFDQVQAVPGMNFVVYDAVPILFFVGQLAMVTQLAAMRRVKVWAPMLVLVDMVAPFIEKDLIPVGAVFLLISFLPFARTPRTPIQPARVPAHAA